MADEYIRLDTTIIAIDHLINEVATGTMARTLFKAKDAIYSQQRYVIDVRPVRRGKWIYSDIPVFFNPHGRYLCSICNYEVDYRDYNYCPNCGADMRGGAENDD